jgi:homopolymeric O-antigen transport system permease protein
VAVTAPRAAEGGVKLVHDVLPAAGPIDQTARQPAGEVTVIVPGRHLFDLDLPAVWRHRELLYFLVWRDVRVRHKQTIVGIGWSILQPLLTMLVLTAVFGRFVGVPSEGWPYSVFVYSGLVPWTVFAQALTLASTTMLGDPSLITKVYFPRLVIPLAAVIRPLVDAVYSLVVLLAMVAWYDIVPGWRVLALPVFLLLAVAAALAVGLWLSALYVRYRDVGHVLPFLVQLWMFASPVAYPARLVPEGWRFVYGLNPMVGVVEGFRWALLGGPPPDPSTLLLATGMVLVGLVAGAVFFRRMERSFADVL